MADAQSRAIEREQTRPALTAAPTGWADRFWILIWTCPLLCQAGAEPLDILGLFGFSCLSSSVFLVWFIF